MCCCSLHAADTSPHFEDCPSSPPWVRDRQKNVWKKQFGCFFFFICKLTLKRRSDYRYLTLSHSLENDAEVYSDYNLSTSVIRFTLTSHLMLVKWLSRVSRTILINQLQVIWNEKGVSCVSGSCLSYWSYTNLYLEYFKHGAQWQTDGVDAWISPVYRWL